MSADAHDITTDAVALPAVVGVVGGGTMGSGIVHVLLAAGFVTVLVDVDDAALARGRSLVRESLEGSARRGKLDMDVDSALGRLTTSTRYEDLATCDLVIEAVPENVELKKQVLGSIERRIADAAVLATNTSSLSLGTLAGTLSRPERFVGMHFFNPVPAQPLLEIVRTPQVDEETLRRTHTLGHALKKETVEVKDSPGFATSRLGVLVGLEAVRMVEEGVASPEDIDKAMVLGYRYPIGPCRLGDLVGHDVRLGIAEYLHEELGERFEPPALLRQMVADGKLGKKSGQGFYPW